jgi:hypothetical protein
MRRACPRSMMVMKTSDCGIAMRSAYFSGVSLEHLEKTRHVTAMVRTSILMDRSTVMVSLLRLYPQQTAGSSFHERK